MDILEDNDNCHVPHPEKSTPQAMLDWAANFWSTATDAKVLKEIGGGAKDQVSETQGALETIGEVALGAGIRAVGGAIAALPAASYLLGREAATLVLKGPAAAADDTWDVVTAPVKYVGKTYEAAQTVARNDKSPKTDLAAAKATLRTAGADATKMLALGIGGSGDLGPMVMRQAANGARSAAMAVGRASFGDDLFLGLQSATGHFGPLASSELQGILRTETQSPVVAAVDQLPAVQHQMRNSGDGASLVGNEDRSVVIKPSEKLTPSADHAFHGANGQELAPSQVVYSGWDHEGRVTEFKDGTFVKDYVDPKVLKVSTHNGKVPISIVQFAEASDGREFGIGTGVEYHRDRAGNKTIITPEKTIFVDADRTTVTLAKPYRFMDATVTREVTDNRGRWLENLDGLHGFNTPTRLLLSGKEGFGYEINGRIVNPNDLPY